MNSQHGGKPLHIKASAGTALIQLAPSERAEPPDLRVLDPNRGANREFICSVEAFLPDFRDEGFGIIPELARLRACARGMTKLPGRGRLMTASAPPVTP